jgi:hypothetical protein
MNQLSVLKKQYREDLEALTQSYEVRRKALKEALLSFPQIDEGRSLMINNHTRRK